MTLNYHSVQIYITHDKSYEYKMDRTSTPNFMWYGMPIDAFQKMLQSLPFEYGTKDVVLHVVKYDYNSFISYFNPQTKSTGIVNDFIITNVTYETNTIERITLSYNGKDHYFNVLCYQEGKHRNFSHIITESQYINLLKAISTTLDMEYNMSSKVFK